MAQMNVIFLVLVVISNRILLADNLMSGFATGKTCTCQWGSVICGKSIVARTFTAAYFGGCTFWVFNNVISIKQQQQQQLSHLSQVFGVGYMNQKELRRIGHMDQFSPLIPIEQYAFTKTFSLYMLSYYLYPCFLPSPLRSFNLP